MKIWDKGVLDLVRRWLLADKLIMRPLQNMVMEKLSCYLQDQDSLHDGEFFSTEWIRYELTSMKKREQRLTVLRVSF